MTVSQIMKLALRQLDEDAEDISEYDDLFKTDLNSGYAIAVRGYLRPREKETQLQRYMVAFAVQGCFGNIDLWLQNGKPETVDEMADITWQAVRAVRAAAAP